MIAFLYLFFFAGYFWLTIKLARWTYLFMRAKGFAAYLAYLLGGLATVASLAVVFWDVIPTWYTHHQRCETEAGLRVYQTPDEWAKANPERFAEVRAAVGQKVQRRSKNTFETHLSVIESTLGFETEIFWELIPSSFNTYMNRKKVVDKHTGKTLFEVVDFASHAGTRSLAAGANSLADYKFWTVTGECQAAYPNLSEKFKFKGRTYADFSNQIYGWNKK